MNAFTRRESLLLALGIGATAAPTAIAGAVNRQDTWRAWAITQGDTRLVVEGIVADGGPGLVAVLEVAKPQGANQKILLLRLKKMVLPGTWTANVIPIPACFAIAPYSQGKYDSIQIVYPDNSVTSIPKIIDAGKGPVDR